MLHFLDQQSWFTPEWLNLRNVTVVAVIAASLGLSLTGCDQIPSFDSSDKAANAAACQSVGKTWETLNTALSSGDIAGLPAAVTNVPAQLDQVLAQATDKQLTEALSGLKTQVQSVIDGNQPDLSGLVSTGVGISARCAVLGATVDLKLPSIP